MAKNRDQVNLRRRLFLSTSAKSLLACSILPYSVSLTGCKDKTEEKTNAAARIIRLQSPWINDAEFIGYFIAVENGYYKDVGLNFEYLPGGPEIVADSMLISKRAEIALTTPDVTINAISKEGAPLKIVGTQYQKNPLGIVSLEENNIRVPKDLLGKTLAVPPANHITINAFLKINGIGKDDVRIVPYQYDPTPLLNGEVDATLDFVTNVPFTIQERGGRPTSFLLYDCRRRRR